MNAKSKGYSLSKEITDMGRRTGINPKGPATTAHPSFLNDVPSTLHKVPMYKIPWDAYFVSVDAGNTF